MTKPGPLLPADEGLNHQIVDTFARVVESDRSWTEKIWAMAAARDGSLSIAFGLGKYINRNVMDGFAGVSRGAEQWAVRASRRLTPDIERSEVGPIGYDVVAPLARTRYRLDANDVVPVRFDVEVEGVAPPAMEERETHLSRSRARIDADIMRFHQSGVARGWVEVDGERTEIDDGAWVGARDRSWGVRYGIGKPPEDVEPTAMPEGTAGMFVWMPVTMTRPDGRSFTLFTYYQRYHGPGWSTGSARGSIELPDGRVKPFHDVVPDLEFRDDNRRLVGGTIRVVMPDATERTYRVEPLSDTGFHLGAGLYGGFEGHFQGEWRGALHVDGEHVQGCDTVEVAHRLKQHRDCIVRVTDLDDGSTGVGTMQSNVVGAHPEMGLTAEASFGVIDGAPSAEVLAGLTAWLDEHGGGDSHEVVATERPSAGYSSETVLVDLRRSHAGEVHDERVVLKLPPSGPAIFARYDFAMQAQIQEAAAAAGIPTAVPARAEADDRWIGVPFLTMPVVAGHIFGEVPALDERLSAADDAAGAALHKRFLHLVADINRIDWRTAALDRVVPVRDNAAELDSWHDYLAWYADGEVIVPALVDALDWCEANQPGHEPEPSLLWGDVRLENVIVDDAWSPVAVLDWEMATIGAAEHDLAWLLTLQATQDALVGRTVPGFFDHDEAVRCHEARLGRPVQDLDWYECFAALRSTAILSRIAHLNDQRGLPNFFPIADNPILDLLAERTGARPS